MNAAKEINGKIKRGDWVIVTPDDEYGCLIGQVIEITKLGTPEHAAETENSTDNIHVNFYAFDYPPERISEIEALFSDLYGEPKTFDELPLDDTIMAPETLIRITELGYDEITRIGNSLAECKAFCGRFGRPDITKQGGNPMDEYGLNHEKAKYYREQYPAGTKIELIRMDDPYRDMPAGLKGIVTMVDDACQIHCAWENGSSLALIPGVDSFRTVKEQEQAAESECPILPYEAGDEMEL